MLKLVIVANAHIYKSIDNKYYSNNIYNNDYFKKYLYSFDEIIFCSKVKKLSIKETLNFKEISIDNLTFSELPWYQGFKGLFFNLYKTMKILKNTVNNKYHLLLRMTQIESIIAYIVWNKKSPLAVEMVNDPKNYFRGIFSFISTYFTKKIILHSNGVAYVTKNYLQKIYPSKSIISKQTKNNFHTSYQTLDLNREFIKNPKNYKKKLKEIQLVHVSNNIVGKKKGHLVVFKVLLELKKANIQASCSFVGSGKDVQRFKKIAKKMNILETVNFVGRIDEKAEMIEFLSHHDLFIFPSRSEGIGRVNIEAMAAGLPVIASNSGGIKELFEEKYLFDYSDYKAYKSIILLLMDNFHEMNKMSIVNINKAKYFTANNQNKFRKTFLNMFSKIS